MSNEILIPNVKSPGVIEGLRVWPVKRINASLSRKRLPSSKAKGREVLT